MGTMEESKIFFVGFLIFLFLSDGTVTEAQDRQTIIGAVVDTGTRIGKEEIISMEIAIQAFNNISSNKNSLILRVIDSGGKSLQAATSANELIKGKQVQAIVGMETWQEAALVAELPNEDQIPIVSLVTPSITPPLTSMRWPSLVRMANNDSLVMKCVASIVGSYGWRRVIAIYEDDGYSTDSGIYTLLSDELRAVGSEIELWLALPQFSSLSDPEALIKEEVEKLHTKKSRVFIFVRSSLRLATYVVAKAKDSGLMGSDSVWITADSVTNLFHSLNASVMSSMEGVIGIKTHFSKTSQSFLGFEPEFRRRFRLNYTEEANSEPGIYALRAYDAISTVVSALERTANNNSPATPKTLLANILSSDFNGLSGKIQLGNRELPQPASYEIINVVGQSYNVVKFWSHKYGFTDNVIDGMSTEERNKHVNNGGGAMQVLGGQIYWPGKLDRVPLGWAMPSEAKQLVIGVPGRTSFEKFVKVENETNPTPTGFCIDVFNEAVKLLPYDLPHRFVPFYGLYDDLVDQVYFEKFDAVVGDITILANRSNYVDFTQPYAETGLTMLVPVKSKEKAWLFVKPFTATLWLVFCFLFLYTMFVVWFLEHRSNPEYKAPWKNQISTALWFTVSTLFFAHKESLRSNYTRVVMFIWLLAVFVVTSSYTASLTSMLTVQRLEPTVTNIETLRRSNSHVGCDGDSFIRKYLQQVFHFDPSNIINISSQYDYPDAFKNGTIKAAFLELPYERVFLSVNSKNYKDTGLKHRFGGLGFVFPKGSPMARDFSKAFFNLSEGGDLNKLDQNWFNSYSPDSDSNSDNNMDDQSLSLSNFWGIFVVTGLTSTIMLVIYTVHLCTKFRHVSIPPATRDNSVRDGIRVRTYYSDQRHRSHINHVSNQSSNLDVLISSDGENFNTPTSRFTTPASEIELQDKYSGYSDSQTRPLRSTTSFPGPDRRIHDYSHVTPEWQRIGHSTPL